MFGSSLVRYSLVASCLVLTLDAAAGEPLNNNPNAGMRYAAISTQVDNVDNRQLIGTLSLTVGDHAWAQVAAGTLRAQQGDAALRPALTSIGGGIAGQQLGATLGVSQRKDDDFYNQRDWNGTLDWHNQTLGVGLDGLQRSTQVRGTVPVANGQGAIVNVPVTQSLRGNGIGVHVRFNPTEQLTLSLGGMHYDYDVQTRQQGNVSGSNSGLANTVFNSVLSNQPLLTQQVLQASGVTRDAAILQRSWNAGIGYRLERAALSAQYFNDDALGSTGAITTIELGAAIFLDQHWTLSPAIGHSSGDPSGGVTFGTLTARFDW